MAITVRVSHDKNSAIGIKDSNGNLIGIKYPVEVWLSEQGIPFDSSFIFNENTGRLDTNFTLTEESHAVLLKLTWG